MHLLLLVYAKSITPPPKHPFPPACSVCCSCSYIVVLKKGYNSSLIIINFISLKTYIHQRLKSMFKHGWYNFREYEVLKYIPLSDVARGVREHAPWRYFFQFSAVSCINRGGVL